MGIAVLIVLDVLPMPPFDLIIGGPAIELLAVAVVIVALIAGVVYARRRGANQWVVWAVALTLFFAVLVVLDWSAWSRNRATQQAEQRRRFETFSTSTSRPRPAPSAQTTTSARGSAAPAATDRGP